MLFHNGLAMMSILKSVLHEKELRRFNATFSKNESLSYIQQALRYFDVDIEVNTQHHIPKLGRVTLIANHPIGALDALALLNVVAEVRSDIKIIGNPLLASMPPLQLFTLPYDKRSDQASEQFNHLCQHLNDEGILVVFPASNVYSFSRLRIKDNHWRSDFLSIAEQSSSPILPVHISPKKSFLFYSLSIFSKPLSTLLLLKEMLKEMLKEVQKGRLKDAFKHANNTVGIKIGELIDPLAHENLSLPIKTKVKLFQKQVYRIGRNKPSLFRTLTPIAAPEDREGLKHEVEACEALGETRDNKKIFLYRSQTDTVLIREIGRLREEAFRLIGEGTGSERDIDDYDQHYMHIVLWDKDDLEVVGAYRLCATHNEPHLYTATLFNYNNDTKHIIQSGLELGRSFIQPRYWGSRSLEYLWYGIAAFLRRNPQYRYLLGAVSISNTFSRPAKDLIIGYYQRYYADNEGLTLSSKRPYTIDNCAQQKMSQLFQDKSAKEAFTALKAQLRHLGYSVPSLYKQYADLTTQGGTRFLGFNIDPDFNDCVDGLVVVDIREMSAQKRKRYGLMEHMPSN
ncbi:MAG: putative hemolysin [Oleiphilaceae bacterium]